MRLNDIARITGGLVIGDEELEIAGAAGIDGAGQGYITYVNQKSYIEQLRKSPVSAVLVSEEIHGLNKAQVIVKNPSLSFAKLLGAFYVSPHEVKGVVDGAFVSNDADIGEQVTIYPASYVGAQAVIGNRTVVYPGVFIGEGTTIGDDCLIYPNVTIRERVTIGSRVIIHPGVVVGSDGFGYEQDSGTHVKIPHVGTVIIGNDVEIGANSTIDRATTGATVIGDGTKIDNLVQIAHNVKIGRNSIIVAQVGIGGSTVIGDYVMVGGQAGIADHAEISSGTMIAAQSGVKGILPKGMYMGSPCFSHSRYKRSHIIFTKLPELNEKILELERKLDALSSKTG
ncbi:UDP-3-O-(3-hydroxymyristoyl)glucosamine N-acyltransferase [Candidatus Magnetomonas plexicatena]|uniref:UDP-3-O-(3-hydroxymyristoyl)glucosamine N-acyltransferase n=1 Tax=Candidatus Magnetomonas plexicatena TaxID=2552947 RepID=UPI001C793814|nr:UDP-3-O-(3-hydroxymyristoyl)glucosamine N-acyltransferase [Nitrospirales bacterium LBB_01]